MKSRVKTWLRICCVLFFLFYSMPALRSAPGDENWDASFGVPGVEGRIEAMTVIGQDVYVGGVFSRIGGVEATNVAKWDGAIWSALGPGLGVQPHNSSGVAALSVVRGELYAGGNFTNSGDVYIPGIAKWNGASWESIAGAGGGSVNSLTWDGRYLYAGGFFRYIGGINASNIARWDGTNWSRLGSGLQYWVTGIVGGPQDYGTVRSLAAFGGVVYAGGRFENAGSIRVTNVARWNGTSWAAMGGLSEVRALAANATGVFAGADYSGCIKWNGSRWMPVGGNLSQDGWAWVLAFSGPDLYVGGGFTSAGGTPAASIVKWNGTQWAALGSGVNSNGGVFAMTSSGSDLFIAGVFDSAGGKPATNIARWRIPHELKIRRAADKALLIWPATGSNLFLEATLNPAEPNWTILSNPPGLHGGECVVTNPVTDPARFYRLRGR